MAADIMQNIFGSTEAGAMMLSIEGNGPDAALLRPIPGTVYAFEPVASEDKDRQLLELIILPESPDCPAESFRSADGKFHTGDLFLEVKPCCYSFCGRNDDWIKSENSLRCDTRYVIIAFLTEFLAPTSLLVNAETDIKQSH